MNSVWTTSWQCATNVATKVGAYQVHTKYIRYGYALLVLLTLHESTFNAVVSTSHTDAVDVPYMQCGYAIQEVEMCHTCSVKVPFMW